MGTKELITAGTEDGFISGTEWNTVQKFLFRVAFVFFILLIVPLHFQWYQKLFSVNSLGSFFSLISGYRTNFLYIPTESGKWGFLSFLGAWGPGFITAIIVAIIWTFIILKKSVSNYNKLYYWLRVLIRYRIAFGLIAFGYIKVFLMQMPVPAISSLQTNFGDYSDYKIYWQSVGVSQWYEIVLGLLEVFIGILFFFRGTTALGAILTVGVLYNISHSNLAYDGGVHVYSAFFVLLSGFLLIQYIPNLWLLFIKEQNTEPAYYYPVYAKPLTGKILITIKYLFISLFVFVSLYNSYYSHIVLKRLKEPVTAGITNATGYYHVTEFTLNGKLIPYSPIDSIRWQDVVFEKYSTLTYKIFKPLNVFTNNGGGGGDGDLSRRYELSGIAGGRRFFYYKADTIKGSLELQDKYLAPKYYDMYLSNFGEPLFTYHANDGEEGSEKDRDLTQAHSQKQKGKNKKIAEALHWHFERPTPSRILLSGLNENNDSIHVVLDKVAIIYPLLLK